MDRELPAYPQGFTALGKISEKCGYTKHMDGRNDLSLYDGKLTSEKMRRRYEERAKKEGLNLHSKAKDATHYFVQFVGSDQVELIVEYNLVYENSKTST